MDHSLCNLYKIWITKYLNLKKSSLKQTTPQICKILISTTRFKTISKIWNRKMEITEFRRKAKLIFENEKMKKYCF